MKIVLGVRPRQPTWASVGAMAQCVHPVSALPAERASLLRSVRYPRRQVEDGGDLPRVMVNVEARVTGKSVRHRIDSCSNRHGHHPRIKVAPELPFGPEARQQLFEEVNCNVDTPTVEALPPSFGCLRTRGTWCPGMGAPVRPVRRRRRKMCLQGLCRLATRDVAARTGDGSSW